VPRSDVEHLSLVTVEGLLPGASNTTLLARDATGQPWVYKPARGERPLWDFPHGSLAAREVAFYRLGRELGLDVVPETVPATGPYGPGSAQRYLDEDMGWDPRPAIMEPDPALWPIAVLDLIANNADRKIGHLLREPERGHIWAIDNGLTFHPDDKLRTVLWSFAEAEIPPHLLVDASIGAMHEALDGVITGEEVDAAIGRLEMLQADPIHPPPPEDRPPMPWPLW
jgi:hypothetical protein